MNDDTNLLEETLDVLSQHGHSPDDIAAVIGDGWWISVPRFLELAKDTNYDNGFGLPEIECGLTLLMWDGSWYSRAEYDGSEWWEHHRVPTAVGLPNRDAEIKRLVGNPFQESRRKTPVAP